MRARLLLVATVVLGACAPPERGHGVAPGNGAGSAGGAGDPNGNIDVAPSSVSPCSKMDLVFVVDNSGSMAEEQANLAQNFPKFVGLLNTFTNSEGKQLDWRAAVTTTGRDLHYTVQLPPPFMGSIPMSEQGENGAFQMRAECGMGRRWVERNDANASSAFSCVAKVGTNGPGIEMPLEGLELALNDRVADGTNKDFRRDDALLAVVILTDEDDCSRTDDNFSVGAADTCDSAASVDHYLTMLDTAAKGHGRWATAVIAGPGPGSCMSAFGAAEEGKRLKEFVGKAGNYGVFSSICAGDLTQSLKDALAHFSSACEALAPIL